MNNDQVSKLKFINVSTENNEIRIINTEFIVSVDEVTEGGRKYYEVNKRKVPKCFITLQGLDQVVNCYTYSIDQLQQIL